MSNDTAAAVGNAYAVAERKDLEGWINAAFSKRIIMMVAASVAFLAEPAAAQDATRGENVFKQCMICHAVGSGAQNKIGPELNGLDGRQSGSLTNFNYSAANKNSSFVWNEATFKQYIANPQAMIPGTKMPFAGLKDPQQINDLWAYLKQFNADGTIKD